VAGDGRERERKREVMRWEGERERERKREVMRWEKIIIQGHAPKHDMLLIVEFSLKKAKKALLLESWNPKKVLCQLICSKWVDCLHFCVIFFRD
jgi:hypothetical protein